MNTRTILIIDEDKNNQKLLVNILQSQYLIEIAGSEEKAFKILEKNPERISAIILAIEMSSSNGYEILNRIHEHRIYSKIPVIVSSAKYSEAEEEKVLYLGAHDFISRPYNPQIIKHRLSNTIELMEAVKTVDLVIKDDLTPLNNKQYFMTRTRELLKEYPNEEFDIMCLDIEQFKMVNDSYGIPTGDRILYKIGEILEKNSESNTVIARFNADIFFITLPHQSENYQCYIDRLTSEIMKCLQEIGVKIKLKICCGIYHIHDKTLPVAAMCDRAELATENIKGQYGKNIAYYEDEIRQQMHNTLAITNKMEHAIKNSEFQIFYQPKYELASECVAGAEALVRWNNQELGFMAPSSFIPLFEQNGFITQLDMFVWETVCKDMREWIDKGNSPFSVSMNVSRADIFNPNLQNILVNLSDKYGIDRKFLHLEITESAYTDNPEQIIKVVTSLRNEGFPIEMDDFGSGYSSLNMLAEIPIDILKLDMGFVKNELEKPSGKGIIAFVISLAKWLNLAVVAEGVETPEQIKILNSMECNYVQGFYFEKPLCKEEFFALLGKGNIKEMYLTSSGVNYIKRDTIEISRAKGNKIGTLLVVDDIDLSRKIIVEMFLDEYDIVETVDGEQAWQYIQENSEEISIILMDLLMPVMDGYQLLKRIRQNEKTKDIPVVVTSQGDQNSEERALSIGADDFVSKPFNTTVLKHRVKNAFINSRIKKIEHERQVNKELLEAELAANRDFLTGLYTRKILESKINDFFAISSDKASVFIMIDVDNFKEVNDSYGHIKGDETIQRVAKIIQSSFINDEVCCRMGGDEFAIFIPRKIEKARLEEILKELCNNLDFMIEQIEVTCSIGACVSPDFAKDYQTIYNNADMALLASKRYGKNQYKIYTGQSILPSFVFYRNMDWLLDEFSDSVIVFAKDTYEILYMNKNACEIANKKKRDCIGKKCYEVLWNRLTPCEHCQKDFEPAAEFLESEIAVNGQKYFVRAKSISWGGIDARVQYIQKEFNCPLEHKTKIQ